MHLLRLMLCELQKKKMRDYKKRSCPVIIIKKRGRGVTRYSFSSCFSPLFFKNYPLRAMQDLYMCVCMYVCVCRRRSSAFEGHTLVLPLACGALAGCQAPPFHARTPSSMRTTSFSFLLSLKKKKPALSLKEKKTVNRTHISANKEIQIYRLLTRLSAPLQRQKRKSKKKQLSTLRSVSKASDQRTKNANSTSLFIPSLALFILEPI